MTAEQRVIAVVGPPRSGVTSVTAALRERMPAYAIVEYDAVAGERPAVVVVVTSAVAPMTESECVDIGVAAAEVDAVIGVVAKSDAHRGWRAVLAANRAILATLLPQCQAIPWLGVAAAPDVGELNLDELVAALHEVLGDPGRPQRKSLRSNTSRELTVRMTRIGRLRERRATLVRERRSERTTRTMTLRGGLHRERFRLSQFVRQRCTALRGEFRVAAAELPRRHTDRFRAEFVREVADVLGELDERIGRELDALALALGVVAPSAPGPTAGPELPRLPATSTGPESRLTMALGAGFGLGVAMAVSRLLAGLAPNLTLAAVAVGGFAGCALTAWLVMTRALLHQRAGLDRWVTEAVAAVRLYAEDSVADALLAAEASLTAALGAREDVETAAVAQRIGTLDDEIRRLTRDPRAR
jgi:hypothetical protein